MKDENTFGERLKKALKFSGNTQRELAEHMGTSDNMISLYVRNESMPPGEKIGKIALFLDVNLKWLMFGEGEMSQFDFAPFAKREKFKVEKEPDSAVILSICMTEKEAKNIFKKFHNCLLT